MRATFSIEDDKLRLYLEGEWLERPVYDRICGPASKNGHGFSRPGTGGFVSAVWSPAREDLLLEFVDEIEDEDVTAEERAEQKAGRLGEYSDNAQARGEAAYRRSKDLTEGIPFGQPILVGHHSEKRHRSTIKKAQAAATRSVRELEKVEYWEWRAKGVLRHARVRYGPTTVYNRIKKYEADIRRWEKDNLSGSNIDTWIKQENPDDAVYEKKKAVGLAYRQRLIDHRQLQIAYWEVIYEEIGGVPADKFVLEKGGFVKRWGSWVGPIVRITRRKGQITSVTVGEASGYNNVVKYVDIQGYRGPEEVKCQRSRCTVQ